eukprot:764685-Hanusia_phi.AAC.5
MKGLSHTAKRAATSNSIRTKAEERLHSTWTFAPLSAFLVHSVASRSQGELGSRIKKVPEVPPTWQEGGRQEFYPSPSLGHFLPPARCRMEESEPGPRSR